MRPESRQPSSPRVSPAVDNRQIETLQARVRELEQELRESQAESAELRRQWASWLALISHDLRGPLTLVLGYAQNLLRRLPSPVKEDDRARRELESIISGARRVDKMIGQVVDAARLEAGLLTYDQRDVDLSALVGDEARKACRLYPEHPVNVSLDDSLPLVYADTRRASQIVASLLSNAALYSRPGKPIEVSARVEEERVVVVVGDHGLGLTDAEHRHLFEKAEPNERTHDVRREGLGLSLSISRQLARGMGGDLWAESDGVDQGSSFYVAFPLLPDDYVLAE